jgi:hypothetical protein
LTVPVYFGLCPFAAAPLAHVLENWGFFLCAPAAAAPLSSIYGLGSRQLDFFGVCHIEGLFLLNLLIGGRKTAIFYLTVTR